MQNCNLGPEVRKRSFNTGFLVARERRLEEVDYIMEELHKGSKDDILKFAKRIDARWNELIHKASSETFMNTATQ